MGDAHEPLPGEYGKVLMFRQTATSALAERIEKLLGHGEYIVPTVDLTQDTFKNYGRMESDTFVPFWHDDETFQQFTEREVGLDKPKATVINEAAQKIFIDSKIPISEEHKNSLSKLASLFTQDEVDELQSYALTIEDENWHGLALAFEQAGMIKNSVVPKVVSPLLALREEADLDIIDFNAAIQEASDAIFGSPHFYPNPEISPNIVQDVKQRDVLPQEPQMIHIPHITYAVHASTIRGEAISHANRTPVVDAGGSDHLVSLHEDKNKQLTTKLLQHTSLLRYLFGSNIVETQRKKMKDFTYIIKIVREREMREKLDGEKWPFGMPAKRPTIDK